MSGMHSLFAAWLSVSFWGGLLILVLLLGRRFWKDRFSRQWQYYVWLLVILRLLLPFGPGPQLPQALLRSVIPAAAQPAADQPAPDTAGPGTAPDLPENLPEKEPAPQQAGETAGGPEEAPDLPALLVKYLPLVWLAGALGLLLRKLTVWQEFMRWLRAGAVPVADLEMLDRLSDAAGLAGVERPVELWAAPMFSSPMLVGFFRPCIVLPDAQIPEKDFRHIVLHELTHFRRGDLFYKWLVQLTVCLHWFNPLVHLMSREIERACELSCDEAVLAKLARLGRDSASDYGKTLLNAMAMAGPGGTGGRFPGALHLSENKRLLQERLTAIMQFRRRSGPVRCLTAALTLCLALLAASLGVPAALLSDPAVPWENTTPFEEEREPDEGPARYYETGSPLLFERAFSRLEESEQGAWLEQLYTQRDFTFFSAAVRGLGPDHPLSAVLAEQAYAEGEIAFFSTLADRMEPAELKSWLDRALEDGSWAFQSVLFDRLGRDGEFDEEKEENEKEAEAARRAEYAAVGVTMDGRNYYYEGQRVDVFLDIRADGAFYTLNMDPAGIVHVHILRDLEDRVTGAALMTEEEVTELLEDLS